MLVDVLLARLPPGDREAARLRFHRHVQSFMAADEPAGEATEGGTYDEVAALDGFAEQLVNEGVLSPEALRDLRVARAAGRADPGGEDASFELISLVGRGGMGDIYLAREPRLRRTVALKRLRGHLAGDAAIQRRFITEAQVTAQLDHPAIVPVYAFERGHPGELAYAMKFVHGETLAEFIAEAARQAERGAIDPSHALRARVELIVPVLNALAYAHRRGVIHRDLKPDNIMVGSFGEVLVMDWGIARIRAPAPGEAATLVGVDASVAAPTAGAESARATTAPADTMVAPPAPLEDEGGLALGDTLASPEAGAAGLAPDAAQASVTASAGRSGSDPTTAQGLTVAGSVIGTPEYMSPEQARGEPLDGAADQYALGLLLQELVTLRRARVGTTVPALLQRARSGQRAPITGIREPVPRELRAIIDKAAALEPSARYPSVEAMADDVRRFLRDESVAADPDTGVRRLQRWIGRHRTLALAVGVGLLLLAGAVAGLLLWRGEVALAAQRAEAQRREAAVMAAADALAAQGREMGAQLHRYEVLLAELATAARIYLAEEAPPSDAVAYRYVGGERIPPDPPPGAIPSRVYGQLASLRRADLTAAPDFDLVAGRSRVDQLARLEPVLRRVLLASLSEDATRLPLEAAEQLVLHRGVPLVWSYFGSADGVSVGMPGTWSYADSEGGDGYDHREEPWYRDTLVAEGTLWDSGIDENDQGLLLSVSQVVRGARGELLGVAALDVAVSRFIDLHLELPGRMAPGVEALLLDARRHVLVRSGQRDELGHLTDYEPPPLEWPEVAAAMGAADVGHLTLPGGQIAFWTRIGKSTLSYLVVGPEEALLVAPASR